MLEKFRLWELVKHVNHLVPESRTAGTANGTGIDTKGYDAAAFSVNAGSIDPSTTVDCKIQESNDDSTWSDITGAAITQLVATDDDKALTIDVGLGGKYNRKRYVRAVLVVTGGGAALSHVACGLYRAHEAPVVNSPVSVIV